MLIKWVCYSRKPRLRLAFFFRFSSASKAASSATLEVGDGVNNPNPEECDPFHSTFRSCAGGGGA